MRRRWWLLAAALLAAPALAQERYDHRGALGLTLATGGEFVSMLSSVAARESGFRLPVEVGGTLAITDHTALRLAGRLAPGFTATQSLAGAIFAGIRNVRGVDQWKTFFDLELAVHVAPAFIAGARGAFGVQFDFLPIMGAYAQLGGQLGGGQGLRLSFELVAGLQFRTYVLE